MLPVHILALCVALAGAAGLRAFLPLFYLSLAVHLDLLSPHAINRHLLDYLNLTSHSVLVTLGALMAAELIAEKIVPLAEALDLPLLLCRIASGVILAFAVVPIQDFGTALTAAIVTGAMGTIPVINLQVKQHSQDAMRLPFYVNFASSLLVDAISLTVTAIAIQVPYAGLAMLHPMAWLSAVFLNSWRSTLSRNMTLSTLPTAPQFPADWPGAGRGR